MESMTVIGQELREEDIAILAQVRCVICKRCDFRASLRPFLDGHTRWLALDSCSLPITEDGSNFVNMRTLILNKVTAFPDHSFPIRVPLPVYHLCIRNCQAPTTLLQTIVEPVTNKLVLDKSLPSYQSLRVETLALLESDSIPDSIPSTVRYLHCPKAQFCRSDTLVYDSIEMLTCSSSIPWSTIKVVFPHVQYLSLNRITSRSLPITIDRPLQYLRLYAGVQIDKILAPIQEILTFPADSWTITDNI